MLKDNIHLKMVADEKYQGGYKIHYEVVLKQLLKRILKEMKHDYQVKGELKDKLANMWGKKHRDRRTETNQKNKTELTAA